MNFHGHATIPFGIILAAVLLPALHARSSPALLDSALAAMRRGQTAQARLTMQQALETYPREPLVKLHAALMQRDTGETRRLLTTVLNDTAVSGPIRAEAATHLGGFAAAGGRRREAVAMYRRAYLLQATAQRAADMFFALLTAGELDSAEQLAVTADFGGRAMGACIQGVSSWARRDFERGLNRFLVAYESLPSESAGRSTALAGCALCAERLGFVNEALRYRGQFDRLYPHALEQSMFARGFAPMGAATATLRTQPRKPATQETGYTIQVGSFGAPANALKLQLDMRKHFDDVRVVEAAVGSKTYFRVRIGSFPDSDSAESFARQRVSSLGLSYKVLNEQESAP